MDKKAIYILLVDGSGTQAAALCEALDIGSQPVKLKVAQSLAEARTHLYEQLPDLVIIGQQLPDGDGVELLSDNPAGPAYPGIIIADDDNTQSAVAAIKAGALDYVVRSAATLFDLPCIVERVLSEWTLVSERRQTEQALRKNEEWLCSFFESSATGMAIISPSGKALKVNPAFCRHSGYSEVETQGMDVIELTHPDDRGETLRIFKEIKTGRRRIATYETRYLCKDGSSPWGHATVAGVFGPDGTLNYFAANVQDISESKRAQEKLLEVNRELDAFVYTVSHDLRTPLTPIIGYAEMLQDLCRERLDKQSLDYLAEIEGQARRMLALLEDLLLLAKVGHLPRPAEPVALDNVVDKILIEMGSLIAEYRILIQKSFLPEIWIPKTLLEQIFTNLLSNAVRYAGREGSPLEIGGERNGDLVRLYVRDHGPGIPLEERNSIFQVFYRGATGKKTLGTGVGLATVQKISNLYGGQAWVEETAGGGSTFWVELQDKLSADDCENSDRDPG